MSIIYQPSGKAREYSPLAANLYLGCNHGCKYCYAPNITRTERQKYLIPEPRRNIIAEFEKDCKKHYGTTETVLFCFMSDPYNSKEPQLRITREALKVALRYKIPIAILTKSKAVLDDIDIIKRFNGHISVGMTLTFDNQKDSIEWEPGASLPAERIETLKTLKENGVNTWASFEPVIKPDQSINMINNVLNYVDVYKIGKINNYNGLDKAIDWTAFLQNVTTILRDADKRFYVKRDLREAATAIKLQDKEMDMDRFGSAPFPCQIHPPVEQALMF